MHKTNKITKLGQIDDDFKSRLYQFLSNNFKEHSLFYNKQYYSDIAQFCDENNVFLSISEYLALNFYFFAKNRSLNTTYYLNTYLKQEKKHFNNEFLASHVHRAKMIIQSLINVDNHLGPLNEHKESTLKIKDILNIYYSYQEEEFEALAQSKMIDDYQIYSPIVELQEIVMTNFLALLQKPKIFHTNKFHKILEDTAQRNIDHLLHYHEKETQYFKDCKLSLH